MKKSILFVLAFLVAGCMGPEERRIKDYLNDKLSNSADKITDVEIIGEDSVLSFTPMDILYNGCLHGSYDDSTYFALGVYYYHANHARALVLSDKKKDKEFISKHQKDWLRLCKIKARSGSKTAENIEVIYDHDGITPLMLGREYDEYLNMWEYKINSLPQNN